MSKHFIYRFSIGVMVILAGSINYVEAGADSEKLPVECIDTDYYDAMDCVLAERDIRAVKAEESLPDDKRNKFMVEGASLLVEKATGLRMGIYKIKNLLSPENNIGVLVQLNAQESVMYPVNIYGECGFNTAIEILKNTSEFIFFEEGCFREKPPMRFEPAGPLDPDTSSYIYYVYEKETRQLVRISGSSKQKFKPQLTYKSGLYTFNWKYHDIGYGFSQIHHEFKFFSKSPGKVKCVNSSEEEGCDNFVFFTPLSKKHYTIIK